MLRKALVVLGPMTMALATVLACEADDATGAGGGIDAGKLDVVTPPTTTNDATAPADAQGTPPAPVSVAVAGSILNGVIVVFHDANGLVLDRAQTGTDGKASSAMPGIAMVTALQARDTVRHAVTWANVMPGDQLSLRELPPAASAGTYTLTVANLLGNRSGYTAYSGQCSGAIPFGQSGTIDLASYLCTGTSPTALLASGVLATTGGTEFAFTKAGPAAPFGGSNVAGTIPGPWATPSTTTLTVTNNTTAATLRASVFEIANGLIFSPVAGATVTTDPASFAYPTGFADALLAQIVTGANGSTRVLAKRFDPGPAVAFDYNQLLGMVTGSTVDATNGARPVVTWGGDSTAATDGGLVTFPFALPGDPNTAYSWTFVVPPGATSVTAPALPADAAFAPLADAGSTSFGRATVQFFEADVFDSPASFRQQQGAVLGPHTGTALRPTPALPANGTFRSTGFALR